MTVSVCIPTYKRAGLLLDCVRSVFTNRVRPIEVVVSDDAFEESTHALLHGLDAPDGILLRHVPNLGPTGQSGNVRNAFSIASFDRLMLIHDDDLLVPGGLDALIAAWDAQDGEVDAVYGFQYIASDSGEIDCASSKTNNDAYFRRSTTLGLQQSNLWAALVGQFPNNGYLIRREPAIRVRYPTELEVGRIPVDHQFGIRYALASKRAFLLIGDHVSIYRRTRRSILRGNEGGSREVPLSADGHLGWMALTRVNPSGDLERIGLDIALCRNVASAIEGYIATGNSPAAARLFLRYFFKLNRGLHWRIRTLLRLCGGVISEWRR